MCLRFKWVLALMAHGKQTSGRKFFVVEISSRDDDDAAAGARDDGGCSGSHPTLNTDAELAWTLHHEVSPAFHIPRATVGCFRYCANVLTTSQPCVYLSPPGQRCRRVCACSHKHTHTKYICPHPYTTTDGRLAYLQCDRVD